MYLKLFCDLAEDVRVVPVAPYIPGCVPHPFVLFWDCSCAECQMSFDGFPDSVGHLNVLFDGGLSVTLSRKPFCFRVSLRGLEKHVVRIIAYDLTGRELSRYAASFVILGES
ncbi:MAG: hypothetical protein KatS3mg104_3066 [Phycisphaerae bacterium]|nr:MAG: hypothetical protein KatS3mg104_3066 [Phycisphaerae bacterium]